MISSDCKRQILENGFVIQTLDNKYLLGKGPFIRGVQARPFSLYRPDFFLEDKKPWIYPQQLFILNPKQMNDFLFEKNSTDKRKSFQKSLFDFKDFFSHSSQPNFTSYQECFVQAKQEIHKNKFQKVVPVFAEEFFKKPSLLKFLQNLFQNTCFLQGFLYGCWDKQSGVLGFTPEFLFDLDQNHFSSMALAGTDLQNSASLLKDNKQVKEHYFVVKGLKEDLSDLAVWRSQKTSEMIFPPLKHLRTDLEGSLTTLFDFERTVRVLHPTSAVGGYPKKAAWTWLKEHRSQKQRSFFSAPFGFFENHKKAFCLTALRNLQWNQEKSHIFSGAGWIAESCLQKEWHELSLKRKQVKSFFVRHKMTEFKRI